MSDEKNSNQKKEQKGKSVQRTMFIGFVLFSIVTLYEFTIVKNPFFDPIPPYVIWFSMTTVYFFFWYKIRKERKING